MNPRAVILFVFGLFVGFGCKDQDGGYTCFPGNEGCACVGSVCLAGLECVEKICEPVGDVLTDPTDVSDPTTTTATTEVLTDPGTSAVTNTDTTG